MGGAKRDEITVESRFTRFLRKVIDMEGHDYQNIFNNPTISSPPTNKRGGLIDIIKINSCRILFEDVQFVSKGYSPKDFQEGWGYSIGKLRDQGVSDEMIYQRMMQSKEEFLREEDGKRPADEKCLVGANYKIIMKTHQARYLYEAVKSGLDNLSN